MVALTTLLAVSVPCVAGVTTSAVAFSAECAGRMSARKQRKKRTLEPMLKVRRVWTWAMKVFEVVNILDYSTLIKEAYFERVELAEKKTKKKKKKFNKVAEAPKDALRSYLHSNYEQLVNNLQIAQDAADVAQRRVAELEKSLETETAMAADSFLMRMLNLDVPMCTSRPRIP